MKKIILIFLSAFTAMSAISQVTSLQSDMIESDDPSASFKNYSPSTPSLVSGSVDVNVPLYTVNYRGVKVPIALSYRSNGIKVEATSRPCGYGWRLTPSYKITRTVVGRPDELFQMKLAKGSSETEEDYLRRCASSIYVTEDSITTEPLYDTAPDLFTLSMPDGVCSFFSRRNPSGGLDFILTDDCGYKIAAADSLSRIEVTDTKGIKYIFGDLQGETNGPSGKSTYGSYPTMWPLRKITLLNGEEISMIWEQSAHNGASSEYDSGLVVDKTGQEPIVTTTANLSGYRNYGDEEGSVLLLKNVTFPLGAVNINLDSESNNLKDVVVTNCNGNPVRICKFTFDSGNKLLTSVSLSGEGVYRFDYNTQHFDTITAQDRWGYYNGITTNRTRLPKMAVKVYGQADSVYIKEIDGADRSSNATFMQANMLTKVTYPTGGYTSYEYEPHHFIPMAGDTTDVRLRFDTSSGIGAGLRLRRTVTSTGNATEGASPNIVKEYVYGKNGNGLANLSAQPTAESFVDQYRLCFNTTFHGGNVVMSRATFINAYPKHTRYNSGEIPAWYDEVAEISSEGKTVYKFKSVFAPDSVTQGNTTIGLSRPYAINHALSSGIVCSDVEYFKSSGNDYVLEKKVKTTYSVDNSLSNANYGISGDSIAARWVGRRTFDTLFNNNIINNLIYGAVNLSPTDSIMARPFYSSDMYSFRPLKERLVNVRQTEYFGTDSVWSNMAITYHPHLPLDSVRTITASDGSFRSVTNFYPINRSAQMSNADQLAILGQMEQKNIISAPFRTNVCYGDTTISVNYHFTGQPNYLPCKLLMGTVPLTEYYYDEYGNMTGRKTFGDIGETVDYPYDSPIPCGYHRGVTPSEFNDNTKFRLTTEFDSEPLSDGIDVTDPAGGGWIRQYDVGGRLFSEMVKGGAQCRYTYMSAGNDTPLSRVRTRVYLDGGLFDDETDLDDLVEDYNVLPSDPGTGGTGNNGGESGGETKEPITPYPIIPINPLSNPTQTSHYDTFGFYDGLGREKQTLVPGESLFKFVEYDTMGRPSNNWMPVPTSSSVPLSLSDVSTSAQTAYTDNYAYTSTEYETSPVSGIAAQTRPGQSQHQGNKKVTRERVVNSSTDNLRKLAKFSVNDCGSLVCTGFYSSNSVVGTKITDEDGRISVRFTDSRGNVLVDRTQINASGQFADTYYAYDKFDRLRFVIPPMASDALVTSSASTYTTEDTNIKNYCYCYRYNAFGKIIEKRLPGQDPVIYLYDKGQKLTLSQTGNQRSESYTFGGSAMPYGEWTYYLYDRTGREVAEGTMSLSEGEPEAFVNGVITASYTADPYFVGGYSLSSGTFPVEPDVSVAYYYDNYNFLNRQSARYSLGESPRSTAADFAYQNNGLSDSNHNSAVGRLTGTLIFKKGFAGGQTSRLSAVYYDLAGDEVQSHTENHLGGMTHVYTKHTATQKPSELTKIVTTAFDAALSDTISERYRYVYDNFGRITEIYHKLNGDNEIALVSNSYNSIGQLVGSDFGGDGVDPAAENTYTYDVQGRTKNISTDQFTQSLTYGYDGNITANQWDVGDDVTRNYAYTYDRLNRLTGATYSDDAQDGADYSATYAYDKNSNPTSVTRRGDVEGEADDVDYLSLHYDGNRLTYVDDYAADANTYGAPDFHDGHEGGNDYTWDKNGNMTKDLNKNILSITWNSLNLPSSITFSTGHRVYYTYDAMGRKQRVIYQTAILPAAGVLPQSGIQIPDGSDGVTETGGDRGGDGPLAATRYRTVRTVDYVGNLVFEDGDLKYTHTPTGFIEDGEYYHQLRDYQGNARVVIDNSGTIYERNNYYPYGLPIADEHYSSAITPYKYSGKEFDTMNGQNLYDFEARFYDPALCQFPEADPLAEDYCPLSPYLYCAANPTALIDPTGLGWMQVNVSCDRFVFFDPNIHNQHDANQHYGAYYHVIFLGEFYGAVYGNGSTSGKDVSVKMFADGHFNINNEPWDGEYHGNHLYIGDISKVTNHHNFYGYYLENFSTPTFIEDAPISYPYDWEFHCIHAIN